MKIFCGAGKYSGVGLAGRKYSSAGKYSSVEKKYSSAGKYSSAEKNILACGINCANSKNIEKGNCEIDEVDEK